VELHGAHGYLICQFLSPLTNHRQDHYGGDLPSRSHFLVEVISAVREAVGVEFPIILRLSADEMAEGGITIDDTVFYAQRAEQAGVDALHISAGSQLSRKPVSIAPMAFPPGFLVGYADTIRHHVRIPVIAVGRINDPQLAEKVLIEGKADLVAMGRALIADPELPAKAKTGQEERIRKCLACNYCIESNIQMARPLRCAVNARAGRENELPSRPSASTKQIWVIGGGPAGMEAARVAREKGHEVRLYERSQKLGGQILAASRPPFKSGLMDLVLFLEGELRRLSVEIKLGHKAPHPTENIGLPDVVVIATGSCPSFPDIPGISSKNTMTALHLLSDNGKTGQQVIVLGGERVGVEVAACLAKQGKEVTITRRQKRLAEKMVPSLRRIFLDFLRDHAVKIYTGVEYVELREKGLVIRQEGNELLLPAETVVLATGSEPVREVHEEWERAGVKTIAVGDCVEPRDIASAIREGFEAAWAL
jgi:NADPH-dependent 2,4-dienoyl-CoA reductase/sulfur reductase-like enzyme